MAEQRWRYEDRTGRAIWLAFDPAFLCVYCDEPVGSLSFGGAAVCPACDCGLNRNGSQWSSDQMYAKFKNARKRFDNMVSDPVWDEYEASHRAALSAARQPEGGGA